MRRLLEKTYWAFVPKSEADTVARIYDGGEGLGVSPEDDRRRRVLRELLTLMEQDDSGTGPEAANDNA